MKDGKIWGCPAPTHAEVERLRTALAQAERELGEIRKSLYLCDQDRTRFAGELTEARAEVERLKAEFIAAIPKCSTDVTDFQMARLAAQGWKIRAEQAEADLARVRAAWPWPFPFPE